MSVLLLFRKTAAASVSPPVNLTPPTITGQPVETTTLVGGIGTWDVSASFAYQWRRGGSDIPGATGTSYTLTSTDVGSNITFRVTATNAGGSTTATSASVGPVQTYLPPATPPVSAVAPWTFVITDTGGVAIGEPLAEARTYTPGVSRTETASFRVNVGSRLWEQIIAGDTMLKVYNSADQLMFWGDIITDELSADTTSKTVAFTAADLSFRLSKRFVGKTGAGVTYTNTDSGNIVFVELAAANAEFPTGITHGLKDTFLNRTVTFTWKRFSDMLAELASISGSYEWTLRYIDGAPPTVLLDLEAQTGSDQTTTVFFEYGTGLNNCTSYKRVRSIEQLATRVYALGQGSSLSVTAYDPGAETLRRFEDVITTGDITDTALLDSLAAAHVAFRHQPRKTVTVTPFPATAPRYGVDWWKGDLVTLRAVIDDVVDTDGTARAWSATITLDEYGNEAATPILEPQ